MSEEKIQTNLLLKSLRAWVWAVMMQSRKAWIPGFSLKDVRGTHQVPRGSWDSGLCLLGRWGQAVSSTSHGPRARLKVPRWVRQRTCWPPAHLWVVSVPGARLRSFRTTEAKGTQRRRVCGSIPKDSDSILTFRMSYKPLFKYKVQHVIKRERTHEDTK